MNKAKAMNKFSQVMCMFHLWGEFDRRLVRYIDSLLTLDKVISHELFSVTVLCITTLFMDYMTHIVSNV